MRVIERTEQILIVTLLCISQRSVNSFLQTWGIDRDVSSPGGLLREVSEEAVPREVYLLQRKGGKLGASLGKTTGRYD